MNGNEGMGMRLFVFLSVLLFACAAQAQSSGVVDMRAYSRQHGFKSYVPKREAPVQAVRLSPAATARRPAADESSGPVREEQQNAIPPAVKEKTAAAGKDKAQTDDISSYIKQNPHVLPDV